MENNKPQKDKYKKLKKFSSFLINLITVLFVSYLIFLLVLTGSLRDFGRQFHLKDNVIHFGPASCDDNQRLKCSILDDQKRYGYCKCEFKLGCEDMCNLVLKPIIYLYPESVKDITVTLGHPERLTTTYPKYTNSWKVTAYPNGDLVDRATGNKLYALYWEGAAAAKPSNLTTGFVVKGEDSIAFLEEKLRFLGLNYKEAEEFIVYWLLKLEANKYNQIYFATAAEIEADMPIELSVKPDTVIRVRMIFQGLDEYREVEPQQLTPAPARKGFTMVEWGGTEL